MNAYLLTQTSKELVPFPHIVELAYKKCGTICFNSLPVMAKPTLRIYCVRQGKFNWVFDKHQAILFPGDVGLVLPGMQFGGANNFFDIGTVVWIDIAADQFENSNVSFPGAWSTFVSTDKDLIKQKLVSAYHPVLPKLPQAGTLIDKMQLEMVSMEMGYITRINQLLDELLILVVRNLNRHENKHRDLPNGFVKLERSLKENLSHQWTVDEMASLVGLGHTAFSEKVKNITGFSPLNYLINIRISKAVNLLRKKDCSVTDIALDTGFYSSQHFATTFKKLTGYSPREFRKSMEMTELVF